MGKKDRNIKVGKTFKYRQQYDEYTLRLRRRNWWWLLLLLPLLLLVQCHKDITVVCVEPDSGAPVEDASVTLEYQAHFLLKDWHLLHSEDIEMTQTTDADGQTVFRDLPCSVFSYIFYCLSQASFSAESDCHAATDERRNFHYTRHVTLEMEPRREDLHVQLRDQDTDDPLPDGVLVYTYDELGRELTDSAKADPGGVVTIPKMRLCSTMTLLHAKCYGYADTTRASVPCQQLLAPGDSATMRLRPIKKHFEFFVKDLYSKQPIAGATCNLAFTHHLSHKVHLTATVTTSNDGKGMGFFDDAHMLSTIAIQACKRPTYEDSVLTGGPWTVEDFIKLDTLQRTIWLRPLPHSETFFNVDSLNGRPIAGVKNDIRVTDADGSVHNYEAFSNTNGAFTVSATDDSKIEIASNHAYYEPKQTFYPLFKAITDKKVRMMPILKTHLFRTLLEPGGTLLPGCSLKVSGSISGPLTASTGATSGSGQFEVTYRQAEELTIEASKSGYRPTTDKVKAKTWAYLDVSQDRRDIPFKADPIEECFSNKGPIRGFRQCYDLHEAGRTFQFTWKLCTVCTCIIVSDGNGNTIDTFGVNSPSGDGKGTKMNHPEASGTVVLRSPTRQVCVTINVVNACPVSYCIKSN